ncbi:hypothetical protein WH8501_17930 [Crocosphaera watsonii WH 8501]|uniref:hypothetical protein n=1 Tax=Crocosphaera TaxID=263510 RepID=UPI000039D293|nr:MULTISPECIES: hypothetical protein [Crocosphaera]MCH2246073.1 hypothetical protein [Crocosphaera sp.]NQZ63385.1 hypothetical protein [Crocosphaera sp.]
MNQKKLIIAAYFLRAVLMSLNNEQLKSAHNWEKAVYTEAEWDKNRLVWIPKNKEANEAKIQEIRDTN